MRRLAVGALLASVGPGCAITEVLSSAGPNDVVFSFEGDTMLLRGSRRPFTVRVEVDGTPIEAPNLSITVSDPSVITLMKEHDSLVARQTGTATLVVRLHDSMFTDSLPSFAQDLRVFRKISDFDEEHDDDDDDDDDVAPVQP
jgi:hypothetical protein